MLLPLVALCLLASCSGSETAKLPGVPASLDATKAALKSKAYVVDAVGFISSFMGKEEPISWSGEGKDTSRHFMDFVDQRKKFTLDFVNDTAVRLVDEQKNVQANYNLENDTSRSVLLKIKYEDAEFSFHPDEPMMVTYTYKIRGIGANGLLLETPRSYNQQVVVLLMKEKRK